MFSKFAAYLGRAFSKCQSRRTGNKKQTPTSSPVNPMMGGVGPASPENTTFVEQQPQQRRVIQTGKPVLGFLYSVSRTAAAEYWPLCQGPNTIFLLNNVKGGNKLTINAFDANGNILTKEVTIGTKPLKATIAQGRIRVEKASNYP